MTFDIKSYPEQKAKCLKLTKSYPGKNQYIDCAFLVLVKSYRKKKNKKFKTGLISLYILLLK